mmetsp:Transcript_15031/g.35462  ORF Transcript_15031/g.35462 Transcript_15031/m.35462 type:complete len:267 (-) Transcript_15031:1115-1915(-)
MVYGTGPAWARPTARVRTAAAARWWRRVMVGLPALRRRVVGVSPGDTGWAGLNPPGHPANAGVVRSFGPSGGRPMLRQPPARRPMSQDSIEPLPELFRTLYDDLHRLAHRRLRAGSPITLLNTTALVHEAYERLIRVQSLALSDRSHFMGYAARTMRSIIVDAARERATQRRGAAYSEHPLTDGLAEQLAQPDPLADPDVLRVHEALEELAAIEPRLAQVVEMRFFGGFGHAEIGAALGVALRTVERDWEQARSYLFHRLQNADPA